MASKIMICYSDAGNGPLSASKALAEAIHQIAEGSVELSIVDILKETTRLGYATVRLYNYLLTKSLIWNSLALRAFYRSSWVKSGALLKYTRKAIVDTLVRDRPSIIIFTNPWIIAAVMSAIKQLPVESRPKTVSLVIDLGLEELPPSWFHPDIDNYFTPTEEASQALIRLGAKEPRIAQLGMPIHVEFEDFSSRRAPLSAIPGQMRSDFRAIPNVLIMGGRAGTKNTFRITKDLIALQHGFPMRITVLCGLNSSLQRRIENISIMGQNGSKGGHDGKNGIGHSESQVLIEGFVPDILPYMREADLLITKPGALTVCEAAALGLPMILDTAPTVMGQEIGNVGYVVSRGIGINATRIADVTRAVSTFFSDQLMRSAILTRISMCKNITGTLDIAKAILMLLGHSAKTLEVGIKDGEKS